MTLPAHIALAVSMALGTAEENVEPVVTLFDKQIEVNASKAPVMALLCSRRAGKSTVLCPWVCEGAKTIRHSVSYYISITQKHARFNIWPLLRDVGQQLGAKLNESMLTLEFEKGGLVALGGMDKLNELEKYRGGKLARAVVDECGAIPSTHLEYLYREVLRPATGDVRGQLAFSGTPGRTKKGWWFDLTNDHRVSKVPLFHWTLRDNPHFPDPEAFLAEIREENGWTDESPTYVREYLGEWCEDPEGLVYPFNAERNGVAALPTKNHEGFPLNAHAWRFVVAIDPAGTGITGLATLASHPDMAGTYVVESESHHGMLIDRLVARCRVLRERYPHAVFVMDTGGLGSTHAQEFTRKYAFGVVPAKKTDRKSSVRWAHDEVLSGRLKVIDGECNDAVREEWAAIGWNDDKDDHEDDAIDHVSDCVLYGLRHMRDYTREEPAPDLRDPTTRLEDEIASVKRQYIHPKRTTRPSWDR